MPNERQGLYMPWVWKRPHRLHFPWGWPRLQIFGGWKGFCQMQLWTLPLRRFRILCYVLLRITCCWVGSKSWQPYEWMMCTMSALLSSCRLMPFLLLWSQPSLIFGLPFFLLPSVFPSIIVFPKEPCLLMCAQPGTASVLLFLPPVVSGPTYPSLWQSWVFVELVLLPSTKCRNISLQILTQLWWESLKDRLHFISMSLLCWCSSQGKNSNCVFLGLVLLRLVILHIIKIYIILQYHS